MKKIILALEDKLKSDQTLLDKNKKDYNKLQFAYEDQSYLHIFEGRIL